MDSRTTTHKTKDSACAFTRCDSHTFFTRGSHTYHVKCDSILNQPPSLDNDVSDGSGSWWHFSTCIFLHDDAAEHRAVPHTANTAWRELCDGVTKNKKNNRLRAVRLYIAEGAICHLSYTSICSLTSPG